MEEILVIDTETSGLCKRTNSICSVTMKVFNKDILLNLYIKPNPYLHYDAKALEINGITLEFLKQNGVSETEAVAQIKKFIFDNFENKPKTLGQNLTFDFEFLDELFYRVQKTTFKNYVYRHYHDTMSNSLLLKEVGFIDTKTVSLGPMYSLMTGNEIKDAHTSYGDVIMTEELFKAQMELLYQIKEKYYA